MWSMLWFQTQPLCLGKKTPIYIFGIHWIRVCALKVYVCLLQDTNSGPLSESTVLVFPMLLLCQLTLVYLLWASYTVGNGWKPSASLSALKDAFWVSIRLKGYVKGSVFYDLRIRLFLAMIHIQWGNFGGI